MAHRKHATPPMPLIVFLSFHRRRPYSAGRSKLPFFGLRRLAQSAANRFSCRWLPELHHSPIRFRVAGGRVERFGCRSISPRWSPRIFLPLHHRRVFLRNFSFDSEFLPLLNPLPHYIFRSQNDFVGNGLLQSRKRRDINWWDFLYGSEVGLYIGVESD
jgi:hypothetical protein